MEEGKCFTNHPGIADFKGHSYLFYHTDQLPGGSLFHRSVCVAEFSYKEDGSIDTVSMCDEIKGLKWKTFHIQFLCLSFLFID